MVKCYSNTLNRDIINNSVAKNKTDVFIFRNLVAGILYYTSFPSGYFHTFQFKKCFIIYLLLFVAGIGSVSGYTYYSRATGNWSGAVWSTTSGGTASTATITSSDAVIIQSGNVITVNGTNVCSSITINAPTANNGITISGSNSLSVGGAIIMNAPTAGTITSTIAVGSGTLSAASIAIPGSGTSGRNCIVSVSTGTITTTGSITFSGTAAQALLTFTGAGTVNIGGTGTLGAGGTFTLSTGTVNYNGAAQTIGAYTYNHLTLSGSGIKTLQTGTTSITGNLTLSGTATTTSVVNLTIGGILTIGSGTTFNASGYDLTVSGLSSISGNLTISSNAGTKIFTGLVTVNSGGTWNNSANEDITFRGGLTNSGTFNAGTGNYTFNTNSQALTGTLSIPNVTVTGVTLTNNNTLTVGTALSGTGGLTQTAGSTLNIGGTSTITTLNATAAGNTVNYAATATQNVKGIAYSNMSISGSGTNSKNADNNITVSGILNLVSANASATQGCLEMGTDTLFMGATATTTGTGDVTGIVKRTAFVVNTPYSFGNQYTTLSLQAGGILPSSVCINVILSATHPWKANAINRYYDIIQTGGNSATLVTLNLHYLASELNGATEGNLDLFDYHISSTLQVDDHGNSNFNTTNKWVGVTNRALTYIAPQKAFPSKYWTLGTSTAPRFTWLGAISSNWTDANNWVGGVPGTSDAVIIPDAATTFFDPTLPATTTIGTINIQSGGILNDGGGSTLTLSGGVGTWHNLGTFNAGTSTVIFTSASATMADPTNFYNVTVNSGANLSLGTNNIMRIGGALVVSGILNAASNQNTIEYNGGAQTVINPNGSTTGYSNLILSGTGTKTLGSATTVNGTATVNNGITLSMSTNLLTLYGDLINAGSGTITGTTGGVTITGTNAQNIAGFTTAGTVTMAKTGGTATLTGNVTGGPFTLDGTGGTLNLGTGLVHTFSGTGTFNNGSLQAGSSTLNIGGNTVTGGAWAYDISGWNPGTGIVNYNGASQTVLGLPYYNLFLSGSGAKTLQTGTTIIGGNLTLSGTSSTILVTPLTIAGDLYISNGTTFDLAAFSANRSTVGGLLTVAGTLLLGSSSGGQTGSNFPINYGSLNLTGGTVNYNQLWGGQTIYSAASYTNLTLGNTSNPQIPGGNLTVIGTLTTAAGGSLDMGTYTLSVGNPNNAGIIKTQNISSAPLTSSGGTWGGTVIFNGASVQTILTSSFNNLTVDNGGNGALLGGNIVVNGTLTLNGGQLSLGNYNLTMGGSALAVTGYNMMILNNGTGSFRKIFTSPGSYIFPVADGLGTMSYVTLNFASGTFAPNAYASVQVYNTIEPNIVSSVNYLNKYWTIGQSGITAFSCTVTANFNNWSGSGGDLVGTITNLYGAEFMNSGWTTFTSLGSPLTIAAVTAFGDFTGIPQLITTTPASLSGFTYAHGSTLAEQSFTVSGTNLTNNLTITPPADYEISTTSGTGYQSTPITFIPSGGNISSQTIYVRFKVTTPVGSFSENIVCSSGSATQNVALSGSVTSSATYYSIVSGNWNANTTWSNTSGGYAVPSGVYPLGGDVVVIERGYTVTVAANAACSSVTISNSHDGNSTLTISGTNSLTVSGAFAMNLPGSTYSYYVNVNAGTLTTGSLTMSATSTARYDNLTVTTGNLTVTGTYTSAGNSCRLYLSDLGTIDFQGTTTLTGNPTLSTVSGSTVRYSLSGTQTCIPATYINLTLAGTSAKTTTGVKVNGILSMEGDGTVTVSTLPTYISTTALQYKGSAAQTTGIEFPSSFTGTGLIINNPNGVTLSAAKTIKSLTLTNGILNTNSYVLSVTNTPTTSITGGSATSFVNGPVKWYLPSGATGIYIFPIGKSTTYLPFSLVNPTTSGTVTIQMEAFISASGGSADGTTLGGISTTEYWSWSTSDNFTGSSVSAYRSASVSPFSVIGSSNSQNGTYINSGGTPDIYTSGGTTSYGIKNSTITSGDTRFFVYGEPPSLWLKADAGTSTTTDGSGISTWNDQSGTANNATAQLTSPTYPTYQSIGWNFNPNIIFNTGYFLSTSNNIYNDMTFFAVYNSTQNNSSLPATFYSDPAIIGCENSSTTSDYVLGTDGGALFFKGVKGNSYGAITSSTYNDNYPKIVSVTRQKSTTINLYVNGTTAATLASDNITLSDPLQIGIGNSSSYSASSQFVGGICEVLGKQKVYSTGARQNFESYLALKYGITITHDYSSSDSIVVYAISGYGYDIAGLGRNTDASYGLNQKVSSSSNFASGSSKVIMATNNDFSSSNISRGTVLTNGQYLIWGHNNLATNQWIPAAVASLDSTVNRIWKVQNTGNVGSVYFQIDLTGYPVSVTGYYSLLVDANTDFSSGSVSYLLTNTSGNLYTVAGVSFPAGTSYFTIAPKRNYWVGTASSTSWGVASNWTAGLIPPTGADVEFATSANNTATPAINDLQLDQNRTIGSLINLSTKGLIIPAGTGLTVNKTITTSSDPGSIYIHSSSTIANGSFIFPNNSSPVFATVEMYSKAFYDPEGIPNYKYHWQYFGIPLISIVASPTFDGSYVRSWDETGTSMSTHWVSLTNSSVLSPFYGYEITQKNPVTILFQGQLVNSDFNSGPMAITTGALFPGEHIYANPYTAAINISQLTFGTGTEATVYLFSTGTYSQWCGQTGSGNNPGQYFSVPKNTAGQNGLPSQIPSMQGILVNALTAGSTATFNIPYKSAVTNNTELQRVGKDKSISSTSGLISTLIDIKGTRFSDKMWLFTVPGCSPNFDNGWDGKKLIGSALAPQLYAVEPDGIYQVNSVDDINNTYLGFQPGEDSIYTLTFTHQNLGLKYTNVYLIDSVGHQTVNISASGTQYSFMSFPTGAIINRFKIVTSPEINTNVTTPGSKNSQLKVFSSKYTVFIDNPSDYQGSLYLFDISGRLIHKFNFTANGITTIQTDLIPGSYLIKAITKYEKITKKLIL